MINQDGNAIKYYRSRNNYGISFDMNMFVEDLSFQIMPIGGRTRRKDFTVKIKGKDVGKIGEIFSDLVGPYDLRDDERLVSTLIREIGKTIIWNGECLFEITENETSLYLFSFTARNTYRVPFYYVQLIPKQDWDFFGMKHTSIPSKKVIRICLPDKLDGYRKHKMLVKYLRTSNSLMPDFWQETLRRNNINFDLNYYSKRKDLFTLKKVKTWGWDRRGTASEHLNGFYKIYRAVQVAWSAAVLREHVLFELNQIFEQMQIDVEIEINGLPSASEIKNIQSQLINKKINFEDAYNFISLI